MRTSLIASGFYLDLGPCREDDCLLVPRAPRESYEQSDDGAAVTAVATYSNFRQCQVKVDEKIAPIK
jgi:hypothetical protein